MQNHYNLIYREEEREMNPLCLDEGIGLIPWSPLARGVLSGNRTKEEVLKGEGSTARGSSDPYLYQTTILYWRFYRNFMDLYSVEASN
jgi:aryl-alcohol dehydrogenase-like predicted oxidoreductase